MYFCVKVPKNTAEEIRKKLIEKGVFDFDRKVKRLDGFVLLPVKVCVEEYECVVDKNPIFSLRNIPSKKIKELCGIEIDSWERYGDVVLIKFPDLDEKKIKEIGKAVAEVLDVKCVLWDMGIEGEFREPKVKIIYGNITETVHTENGIKFKFDPTKIMFSSGNVGERIRMSKINMEGEVVVDMFAGIGYFSLPIAKYTGAKRVYACEKNPVAFRYLCENVILNNLERKVIPIIGDNREVAPENIADRVVMGYIKTEKFLEKAMRVLKKGGGIIHYHDVFHKSVCKIQPINILKNYGKKYGFVLKEYQIRKVKSYAPNLNHMVVDAVFIPQK